MSRIPPRILVPIVAAVCCTVVLFVFLWWNLASARLQLTQKLRDAFKPGPTQSQTGGLLPLGDLGDTGDEALLHLRRGDLLALQGEWGEASVEYSKAVDAGGGLTALRKLEQAQLQIRDIPAARATLEKLRRAGARGEDLLLVETIILLRTGELVKAGQLLQSAQASPQQQYGLALLGLTEGNLEEAKAHLAEVIAGWEPVLRSYARILQSAFDEFALFPNSPPLHRDTLLARALAQVHECELALPLLSKVTREEDDYRDAWIVQGYCELTTERRREAVNSFNRAYDLDPEKPEVQYFLGRSYAAMDDSQNAITFLRYALQNGFQPEADVRRLIAKQALKIGNAALVLEQEEALTKLPDANLDTYREFVAAAVQIDRKQDAILKATEATQKWPNESGSYELLGDAFVAADQKEEAKKAYDTALEKKPDAAGVKEKRGKL